MWRYIAAALFLLIGALEIILALNGRMREEILKNSPAGSLRASPVVFLLAGVSAFVLALGLLFYNRFF